MAVWKPPFITGWHRSHHSSVHNQTKNVCILVWVQYCCVGLPWHHVQYRNLLYVLKNNLLTAAQESSVWGDSQWKTSFQSSHVGLSNLVLLHNHTLQWFSLATGCGSPSFFFPLEISQKVNTTHKLLRKLYCMWAKAN